MWPLNISAAGADAGEPRQRPHTQSAREPAVRPVRSVRIGEREVRNAMSALVRTLLRLLPAGVAARLRFGRPSVDPVPMPAGRWECVELAGPAAPELRTARELVVGRPDD